MTHNSSPSSNLAGILADWTALVVDDEPDNLDVARRLLQRAGARVYMAENGRQALDLLHTMRPDFILSDLSMPEMDGWTFIAALQKERNLADIPVIALTAFAMSGDRERAFAAGFANYLTKPLDVNKFVANLVAILVDIAGLTKTLRTDSVPKN